jgi:hypothetical protein
MGLTFALVATPKLAVSPCNHRLFTVPTVGYALLFAGAMVMRIRVIRGHADSSDNAQLDTDPIESK